MSLSNNYTTMVTRQAPDGEKTCQLLNKQGINAIWQPMFSCHLYPHIPLPTQTHTLLVTSMNGIRALLAHPHTKDWPIITVGARSAEFAKSQGFKYTAHANGTALTLVDYISQHINVETKLCYIRGQKINTNIMQPLKDQGYDIIQTITYSMKPVALEAEHFNDQLNICNSVIFFSKRTLEQFLKHTTNEQRQSLDAIVMSTQIAEIAYKSSFNTVIISDEPTQEALLLKIAMTAGK